MTSIAEDFPVERHIELGFLISVNDSTLVMALHSLLITIGRVMLSQLLIGELQVSPHANDRTFRDRRPLLLERALQLSFGKLLPLGNHVL